MFRTIRKAQPSLPIVMLTSTTLPRCSDDKERRKAIIYKTYQNALETGDKNVYFLDGSTFFDEFDHGLATVEGCHPNDLGFVCIAKAVGDMLKRNKYVKSSRPGKYGEGEMGVTIVELK